MTASLRILKWGFYPQTPRIVIEGIYSKVMGRLVLIFEWKWFKNFAHYKLRMIIKKIKVHQLAA